MFRSPFAWAAHCVIQNSPEISAQHKKLHENEKMKNNAKQTVDAEEEKEEDDEERRQKMYLVYAHAKAFKNTIA